MPAKKTKKAVKKKRQRIFARKAGSGAFKFIYFIAFLTNPMLYAGRYEELDLNEIPPFVVLLAVVMALIVIGFIVYVGAILLGESWHKYV